MTAQKPETKSKRERSSNWQYDGEVGIDYSSHENLSLHPASSFVTISPAPYLYPNEVKDMVAQTW